MPSNLILCYHIECASRYRNIPSFGRATIRKFHSNASAMKKLAARDFEDLLQVLSDLTAVQAATYSF